jgi:sarcosine oxidase delta subunit
MKAIKYEKDAVLIKDGDIEAWVDVDIRDEDVRVEWNKYIFFTRNSKHVAQSEWQDNCDNFLEATSLAVQTLEEEGFIYQDESGKWFSKI